MRARLAHLLRRAADRLSGQPELDALRLDVRRLEMALARQRRLTEGANAAAERAYAERDRAWAEAAAWHGTVDDCNTVIALQGQVLARQRQAPSLSNVVHPVFGRRNRPPA